MELSPSLLNGPRKLLRLARINADALRADLADIKRARLAAEASMRHLDDEMAAARETDNDAAAHDERIRERRLYLQTTLITLRNAEEDASEKLESVTREIKKLQALVDQTADAAIAQSAANAPPAPARPASRAF